MQNITRVYTVHVQGYVSGHDSETRTVLYQCRRALAENPQDNQLNLVAIISITWYQLGHSVPTREWP